MANEEKPKGECFVIMPISDPDGYDEGHFQKVYQQIISPACTKGGYKPVRADENPQTNLIQLDIIQRLIDSPMAICDLSSRNPNVLLELGIRQAFDMPVVLIQEENTPHIFDINSIRTIEYRSKLLYDEVPKDQEQILNALLETKDMKNGVNSFVSLLSNQKAAQLQEVGGDQTIHVLNLIQSELRSIKKELNKNASTKLEAIGIPGGADVSNKLNTIQERLERLPDPRIPTLGNGAVTEEKLIDLNRMLDNVENYSMTDKQRLQHRHLRNLVASITTKFYS